MMSLLENYCYLQSSFQEPRFPSQDINVSYSLQPILEKTT